jgi:Tol biopolymer transport system component
MGEVYRAKDTRLGRDVAVKILPAHLSQKPELRERFEREARAISSLNHPYICTLYDVGREGDADYLVMELLGGETLASRLARGPLRLDEALTVAAQIADALAAAHKQGIVHRDLKPANVALTKSGAKVLDFGVAKLRDEAISETATRTTPLTGQGAMIGTVQYMAPEQLEGKPVDSRADLFAFGGVLYEMLTGKRAFEGQSQASVIAQILTTNPRAVSEMVPTNPPALDRVVTRCLAKDPDERWQSAADLKAELRWTETVITSQGGQSPAARKPRWIALAGVLALVIGAIGVAEDRSAAAVKADPSTCGDPASAENDAREPGRGRRGFSPDGSTLAITTAGTQGKTQIWTRRLDALTPQPLAGTDDGSYPFWSPDGAYLGFFADGKLKKLALPGGSAQTICEAKDGRGAAWLTDGTIVFAPEPYGPLFRVQATGGTPVAVTKVEGARVSHRLPRNMPDSSHVLFFAGGEGSKAGAYVLDLTTGKATLVVAGDFEARWVPPDWFVYLHGGQLIAQRRSLEGLQPKGEPVPIAEGVEFILQRHTGNFAFSSNGLLAYSTVPGAVRSRLTWFDLDGKKLGAVGEPAFIDGVSLSPDSTRAIVQTDSDRAGTELWMYDLTRGVASRLSLDIGKYGIEAVWAPDSKRFAYNDETGIRIASADELPRGELIPGTGSLVPYTWTSDGRSIVCTSYDPKTKGDLVLVSVTGLPTPHPLVATPAMEDGGDVSPDLRWLAFASDESGTRELYVTTFPKPGRKWRVTTDVVGYFFWSRDSRCIVFRDPNENRLSEVRLTPRGSDLELSAPTVIFGGVFFPSAHWDHASDGKRILVAVPIDELVRSELLLVTDWAATAGVK